MRPTKDSVIIILSIITLFSLVAGGYFYLQDENLKKPLTNLAIPLSPALTLSPASPIYDTNGTSDSGMTVNKTGAEVIFEGTISSGPDVNELYKKIVQPYLDYYEDQEKGSLLTLTISENPYPSKTTSPYLGTGIFKNGANEGFVIDKKNGEIDYWVPSCMICTFSESFKTKYPEIVKNFEP
ncbi:hypothetical protein HY345_00490 [Candidatus Microgenomates bacterium]|nr:hypothetical protein [Candidatus Microgenomates bacterium]